MHTSGWLGLARTLALLLLVGCFSWGPRAKRHLPSETALQRTYDYRGEVLVIGAGAAGLSAARVLEDNGIAYTVLEATDRIGGRLKSSGDFADIPLDLGAEWIHNRAEILDTLSGTEGTTGSIGLARQDMGETYWWTDEAFAPVRPVVVKAFHRFMPEYKFTASTWFDFVDEQFGQRVAHRVQLQSTVSEVDYSGDRVRVTTTDGVVHTADKVLVTVSIGVLQAGDIRFVPALDSDKTEAIARVRFPPGFKGYLKFQERFYPDTLLRRTEQGEMAYYHPLAGKESDENILGVLVTGEFAEPYYALESHEEIVQALLFELDELFEGRATPNFTGAYRIEDWGRNTAIKGTWVEGFRIPSDVVAELNRPLDGRVYFAGEACDRFRQLGVPGAILSGFDAVDRLLTGQE